MAEATGLWDAESPLYVIGDAASRRGLSRVGYFITLNGPLNGHLPSLYYASSYRGHCRQMASLFHNSMFAFTIVTYASYITKMC